MTALATVADTAAAAAVNACATNIGAVIRIIVVESNR
jgi:hypothetical protein